MIQAHKLASFTLSIAHHQGIDLPYFLRVLWADFAHRFALSMPLNSLKKLCRFLGFSTMLLTCYLLSRATMYGVIDPCPYIGVTTGK